jgi:transposase
MASDKVVGRRRYSEELKAEVVAACDAPGASVGKVAMARGLNANLVHRWRQLVRGGGQGTLAKPRGFVAVAIAPAVAPQVSAQGQAGRDIEVELRCGAVTMKVVWPVSAAADFAAWTRELLR